MSLESWPLRLYNTVHVLPTALGCTFDSFYPQSWQSATGILACLLGSADCMNKMLAHGAKDSLTVTIFGVQGRSIIKSSDPHLGMPLMFPVMKRILYNFPLHRELCLTHEVLGERPIDASKDEQWPSLCACMH